MGIRKILALGDEDPFIIFCKAVHIAIFQSLGSSEYAVAFLGQESDQIGMNHFIG